MAPSIRTFLLINLLLSVTLITSFSIIGNLFLEHRDLRDHLDTQLTFTALTVQAFVDHDINDTTVVKIQRKINYIPDLMRSNYCKDDSNDACHRNIKSIFEKIQFQVWNQNGKLILRSFDAPEKPLYHKKIGFSDHLIHEEPWRIYVSKDNLSGVTVAVAERYTLRDQLEAQITQDSILIMVITYPFLGLLIWVIVGRSLASIKRVTEEVHRRAASYLKAVNIEAVPPEIKPLVDELNELFIRLRAAFQREKRFAADAAHELRTPLAALRAQAQVALNATDDEEKRTALLKVLKGVDRSAYVVQQLLTLSRMVPEAGLKNTEPVNLNKEATQIIADLVPAARKKNIELELDAAPKPHVIIGSPTAIGILLRNLVDNAIRYTPQNGKVKVVIEAVKNKIIVKVIDNGPGIPEELRKRVFERFFRIIGTQAQGSGLGLGIVQQIAQMHKAKIELATPATGTGLEVRAIFKAE